MKYKDIIEQWKRKSITTVYDLDNALENFRIVFAYNSGVIENKEVTFHNTREIFENRKLVNFTGDLRTVFEMQNQKECYEFLRNKIVNREVISSELIKDIHKKLTQGTYDERRWESGERPGEYKVHDYVVADEQGAPPEEVSGEIEELCDELQEIPDKGENILKAAAYLHCKFENTHPFADDDVIIRTKLEKPSKIKGLALI